ncbi:MAG: MBL fold metallo-hydrolase, partial [Proteobacteria bacterium]|nr:MBL fold metallo-hydrolase [Pseudomonadota bacterium]
MNLTIYACRGTCLIVDCGLSFAEPYEIGIDAHIPAWEDLEAILGCKPTAYLITHGHEDHLGALPYFLAHWAAPVYIGPWARELLKDKLRQMDDDIAHYEICEMQAGEKCQIGPVKVDWVHVPHSIPHCCSLVLDAGDGLKIYHTGDFKLKGFQPAEADLPLQQLASMAKSGAFLAMVADSTNALTPGHCPGED